MSIINNWQALIKPSKLKLINDENAQKTVNAEDNC